MIPLHYPGHVCVCLLVWLFPTFFINLFKDEYFWQVCLIFCISCFIDGSPETRLNVKFVQDTTKFWYKPDISREQGKVLACVFLRVWSMFRFRHKTCTPFKQFFCPQWPWFICPLWGQFLWTIVSAFFLLGKLLLDLVKMTICTRAYTNPYVLGYALWASAALSILEHICICNM